MKRIVCVALSALLCCVGSAEAEKQQLHKGADQSVQREHTLTVATNTREEHVKAAAEDFHITPADTPDHVIGEGGPLVMDRQETKTVQYSDVDAVNRAINAVAMSNVSNAMYGAKG